MESAAEKSTEPAGTPFGETRESARKKGFERRPAVGSAYCAAPA